jgi:hypothetical protein
VKDEEELLELWKRLARIERKINWIGEMLITGVSVVGISLGFGAWAGGVWGAVGAWTNFGIFVVVPLIMHWEFNRMGRQ